MHINPKFLIAEPELRTGPKSVSAKVALELRSTSRRTRESILEQASCLGLPKNF